MKQRADAVADLVLNTFRDLPKRFKPRSAERKEWVPIAGIVLKKDKPGETEFPPSAMECVALATGMKCHPHARLPQLQGCVLHDWHAEILAFRAFNRFLLDECAELAAAGLGKGSPWLKWQQDSERLSNATGLQQPFQLQDDVSIHMYCSEAPCGDASMELTMAKQDDPTPWASSPPSSTEALDGTEAGQSHTLTTPNIPIHGRGHFDQLGKVRRKPSRPDAPPTLSKSCSDKLALKQCTGLLSAWTAQLIWPGNVYLESLILSESEYVSAACERAFGSKGRLAPLADRVVQERWRGSGFAFTPFRVLTTKREFEYSKRYIMLEQNGEGLEPAASNRSCVYTKRHSEVLINGVLEGRKWYELRGASKVSRRSVWKSVAEIAMVLDLPSSSAVSISCQYGEAKKRDSPGGREAIKEDVRNLALQGWQRNDGDDCWTLSDEELATLKEQRNVELC